ncbi:MAG: holo-ACP synthase [Ignavibacteria bacterium]|nr:holo-ACP synthase [Ignavibacteria bacterium]
MVIGVGIDIIEIERIKKSVDKLGSKFLDKIYTELEKQYSLSKANKYQHLAARFAAKEAIIKALSSIYNEGFRWKDIEIFNESGGMPKVKLSGKLESLINSEMDLKISMSHSENYVTCFAILYSVK